MSLVREDIIAILAIGFNPSEAEIEMAYKLDKMRNPHNESHKPKLRDRIEIIVDYKLAAAKMLYNKLENEK